MHRNNIAEDSVLFVIRAHIYNQIQKILKIKKTEDSDSQQLFILSKFCKKSFFEAMPKTFTISTKNTVLHFNLQMLKETSPVISEFIQDNPNENNYEININDDENILAKFEKLYQGKSIVLKEDELPVIQRFIQILQIQNVPNYLKQKSYKVNEINSEGKSLKTSSWSIDRKLQAGIVLYQKYFINFINKDEFKVFKITTKQKEYNCSIYGVNTSTVICQILSKEPTIDHYEYNFDDDEGEFQLICDFFNGKKVDITSNNMNSLKSIAEDLQINCILQSIDNCINNFEKVSTKLNEKQNVIDSIEELFDLLYNINNYGIEKVKYSIVQSKWSKKDKNVEELSAFILQVVKPSFSLQKEMADLLIELNKESNEDNQLDLLIPFTVKKLMTLYWPQPFDMPQMSSPLRRQLLQKRLLEYTKVMVFKEQEDINLNNRCVYSFIRILYKRGIIPKEEIIKNLKNYPSSNYILNAFFLPEIFEVNPKYINTISDLNKKKIMMSKTKSNLFHWSKLALKYLPDKIDLYERMLDSMEPDDELTKSIIHDDVDTLQRIINQEGIDIENYRVPYNIFDDFEEEQKLINYTALRGSLKCFKYIKLNGSDIDEDTTYFSIFGGNNEIIKIVEQSNSNDAKNDNKTSTNIKPININKDQSFISFWFDLKNNENTENFISIKSTYVFNKYDNEIIQFEKYNPKSGTLHLLNYCNINNIIAPTIAMHKYQLFDWFFENKFDSTDFKHIAILSALCGNARSLISILDNGFIVTKKLISCSARSGFLSLTNLLLNLYDEKETDDPNYVDSEDSFDYKSIVHFGNLDIFKLFINQMNERNLKEAFLHAIVVNSTTIIQFILKNQSKFGFTINDDEFINSCLKMSLRIKSALLFNYLVEQFKKLNPQSFNLNMFSNLLSQACLESNLTAVEIITDFILKENPNYDFTDAFINAAKSKSNDICQFFFDRKLLIDFKNCPQITDFGAVDIEVYKKIINNVEPNIKFLFNDCIHEAIQNKNIEVIDFILKENPPVQTELAEAVQTDDIEVVDLILKYNSKPTFINQKNSISTPLIIAAKNKNLEIVKRLLSIPGIDPSLYDTFNTNALTTATRNYDIDIIDAILNFYGDDIENHVDLIYRSLDTIMSMVFDQNRKVSQKEWSIILKFLQIKKVNPNYMIKEYNLRQYDSESFLYMACFDNEIDIVKHLLSLENIDPNIYDSFSFNTPLIICIENNYLELAELLIKHPKTNINLKNSKNESPLMIAIVNNHKEIIDLLIKDERFDPIESRLNFAFIYANKEISDQLYSLSFLDVNEQFDVPYSPMKVNSLIHSVKINDVEKIDKIISHRSFDIYKSGVKKAIFISAKKNNIEVFRKLIELIENDVNIINEQRQSLLACASKNLSGNIVDEILNNEHFENKNDQLLTAFIQTYSDLKLESVVQRPPPNNQLHNRNNRYNQVQNTLLQETNQDLLNQESIPEKSSMIEIMKKLIEYDREHEKTIKFDSILPNGKRFFTAISKNFSDIGDVCHFLISEGVDVNKPDSNNVYPLEHAIEIGSIEMVQALVNTEKIAKLELPGGNTYLHCAAFHKNPTILSFLLERKINDLNAVNELGETPFMIACKRLSIDCVELMMRYENLDYLHKNKNGRDVLDFFVSQDENDLESFKKDKIKFFVKLNSLINEIQKSLI